MASEERKAADDKIKEENLFNSLGAEDQQAETEAFQCGRCKQVFIHLTIMKRPFTIVPRENAFTGKRKHGVLMNQ
jgi:hypothetical protein